MNTVMCSTKGDEPLTMSEVVISIKSDNEKSVSVSFINPKETEEESTCVLFGSHIALLLFVKRNAVKEWTIEMRARITNANGIGSTYDIWKIGNNKHQSKFKLGFSIVDSPPITAGINISLDNKDEWSVTMKWNKEICHKVGLSGTTLTHFRAEINLSNNSGNEWTINMNVIELSEDSMNIEDIAEDLKRSSEKYCLT